MAGMAFSRPSNLNKNKLHAVITNKHALFFFLAHLYLLLSTSLLLSQIGVTF